jgi:hypothetical protein
MQARKHHPEEKNMSVFGFRVRRSWPYISSLFAMAALMPGATFAEEASESLTGALKNGEVSYDLRLRYEGVDQDGTYLVDEEEQDLLHAKAATVRLRLGYKTGVYHGLFAFAELEGTEAIGGDEYNSTSNGRIEYPVVADPQDAEFNRIFLAYKGVRNTVFKFGRQRIKLDNNRFIGNVGFRQNEQTFDALTVESKLTEKMTLVAGHIFNVNRIFGEHHPDPSMSDTDTCTNILNVSYGFEIGRLTAYIYQIKLNDAPAASHQNLGLRFSGDRPLSDKTELLYAAEYAKQSDYADGDPVNDAEYQLAELGMTAHGVTLKAGYEVLGGDGTYAFVTPLATLHAFNGWTDKFISTPPGGLEDLYFLATAKIKGWKLQGVYHDFTADEGGEDYGKELGFLVARKFREFYGVSFKYASYSADGWMTDTDKFWITLQFKR